MGHGLQLQHDATVDAGIASQRTESSSSYVDGDFSDSDLNLSSRNNGGYPSEDERGYSSTRKHSPWSELGEQRLLVYKKEDKSWK